MSLIGSVVPIHDLMKNKSMDLKKKIFLIVLLLALFVFFAEMSVIAQEALEVEYPTIGEFRPTSSDAEGFPDHLRYAINFLTIAASVVAFGALVYGGFLWMTSEGEPLKMQKSKERITASLIGLVIVLGSFLLLNSIDPQLVELEEVKIEEVDDIDSPGIYLSLSGDFHQGDEDGIRENVRKITSSERALGNLEGNIQAIRIVNPTEGRGDDKELIYRYVVTLHSRTNFEGRCRYYLNNQESAREIDISDIGGDVSSISVLRAQRYGEDPYGGVTVYDKPEFHQGASTQRLSVSATESFSSLNTPPWSVDIEGSYGLILASGSDWGNMGDGCAVFASSRSIPNLTGHRMNRCSPHQISAFFAVYQSCSTHYALFPLYRR